MDNAEPAVANPPAAAPAGLLAALAGSAAEGEGGTAPGLGATAALFEQTSSPFFQGLSGRAAHAAPARPAAPPADAEAPRARPPAPEPAKPEPADATLPEPHPEAPAPVKPPAEAPMKPEPAAKPEAPGIETPLAEAADGPAPDAAAAPPPSQPSTAAEQGPSGTPAAERAPPAFDAGTIAAAYAVITGQAHPDAAALAATLAGPDWVALACSLESASGPWRALLMGMSEPELPAAALATALQAGLVPLLRITEAAAVRADRIRRSLDAGAAARGEAPQAEATVSTAQVGAKPESLPASALLAQDLLREAETWDLVRIEARGVVGNLLTLDTALLGERVRWLMLRPESRGEEAAAIRMLHAANWTLVAERPAALRLGDPRRTDQLGAQLWRGPLA